MWRRFDFSMLMVWVNFLRYPWRFGAEENALPFRITGYFAICCDVTTVHNHP